MGQPASAYAPREFFELDSDEAIKKALGELVRRIQSHQNTGGVLKERKWENREDGGVEGCGLEHLHDKALVQELDTNLLVEKFGQLLKDHRNIPSIEFTKDTLLKTKMNEVRPVALCSRKSNWPARSHYNTDSQSPLLTLAPDTSDS